MATDITNAYAEIIKAEKQADGTMLVYGKATDDTLDIDQQICDPAWLSTAMPQWFKTGGNIREQHSSIAAGVAKEYEEKADGHYISALVVDPVSVKKVEHGVLKGFSIGIKSPRIVRDQKAANGRIIDGQIVEVSLVDRPANPNAKLVMAKSVDGEMTLITTQELLEKADSDVEKREFSTQERQDAADAGQAMPDGSYPIKTVEDLKNAIQAFGRAKDPAATKKHIIRRARALNATNLLPEGWNVDKELDVDLEKGKAMTDSTDCGCDGCKACKDAGGCDKNPCMKCAMAKSSDPDDDGDDDSADDSDDDEDKPADDKPVDAKPAKKDKKDKKDKSADVNKCLECGCHQPANAHGASTTDTPAGIVETNTAVANVSTATTIDTSGSLKTTEPNITITNFLNDEAQNAIIEKAIKSATESVKSEIELLKAAKLAAEQKAVELEQELEIAKSVVIPNGPARAASKGKDNKTDKWIAKAIEYRLKAANTNDPALVKGYKALEREYLAKAGKTDEADLE